MSSPGCQNLASQESPTLPARPAKICCGIESPTTREDMNNIDLNHRHAVITGGAQGIGLAIATRILASGASVSLWDRDVELLNAVLAQFADKDSISVEAVDVADPDSVSRATEATLTKHGAIDILVANAGIAGPNHKAWEYPIEAWRQVTDINLLGVFLCCRAIVPYMLRRNYGPRQRNCVSQHRCELHHARSRSHAYLRSDDQGAHRLHAFQNSARPLSRVRGNQRDGGMAGVGGELIYHCRSV